MYYNCSVLVRKLIRRKNAVVVGKRVHNERDRKWIGGKKMSESFTTYSYTSFREKYYENNKKKNVFSNGGQF